MSEAAGDALLTAAGLVLRRGGRELLAGVDLELRPGQRWVLRGPNGAGKSTLARCLAGLIPPDAGALRLADGLESPLPLLFQDPDAQLAAATVRDEIALGARREHEAFVEAAAPGPAGERVADALARYALAPFARRNPHALSGGEKRRLGLAALSVLESPLLILDEPELHLDGPSWRAVRDALDDWLGAESGRCLLEITRDPARLEGADGLILLDAGRVLAAGPVETLRPRLAELDGDGEDPADPPPPPRDGELLAARGLRLERPGGGPPLLDELDLTLRPGERLLLTGENGSGKSSLLLLLADLADPDGGVLRRSPDLETGLAFQDPERLCFAETVAEELAFGMRRRTKLGREAIAERAAQALALLGLAPERFLARDPFSLSAGELRRVALACVMSTSPDLLILDEPAAALDAEGRARLRDALAHWPGALIWSDCRVPEAMAGFFHRRLNLAAGRLSAANEEVSG